MWVSNSNILKFECDRYLIYLNYGNCDAMQLCIILLVVVKGYNRKIVDNIIKLEE